jgi:hypothetical protein
MTAPARLTRGQCRAAGRNETPGACQNPGGFDHHGCGFRHVGATVRQRPVIVHNQYAINASDRASRPGVVARASIKPFIGPAGFHVAGNDGPRRGCGPA